MKKEPLKKGGPKKDNPGQYQKQKKLIEKNRYLDVVGLSIMILLGIIIYSNSFNCSFHFDDISRIVDNRSIRNLADVKTWWNYYPSRPVSIFTFALNYHFGGLDIRYYHLVNLVIHLINACLVWWLTLLIFSSPVLRDYPIGKHKKVLAIMTALLFVSHPLATQSVTYIVQRMASMAAMFYLLSLALYVRARLSKKGNISKYLIFAGSLISSVFAVLTKENAFTLPLAIVLFEIFFLRTKKLTINFKDYRVILLILALVGVLIFIPLKFSFSIFKPFPPLYGNTYTITSLNYLFTQFSVIAKYIQLLFLPINQNLDYDFPISNNFFDIRSLLSFFLLLVLIVLSVFFYNKYRIISFGIFWFFLTLLIESSIVPLGDVIYEHRTYLPSFGFFLILSSGIYLLLWNKHKYVAISILVIIIGSNSFLTYERNKVWKNELSLWSDVVSKSPDKARPNNNLGMAYYALGQRDKAMAYYTKAIRINPDYDMANYNRGVVYGDLRQWNKAIADYSRTISISPEFADAYYNRGVAYYNLGQRDKAIADYSSAIRFNPEHIDAYSNRGVTYSDLGQWDKAIADYSRAIEIDPLYTTAYNNRGIAYSNLGRWNEAIADFSKTIEIDPNNTAAYSNRDIAYGKLNSENKQ